MAVDTMHKFNLCPMHKNAIICDDNLYLSLEYVCIVVEKKIPHNCKIFIFMAAAVSRSDI